MSPRFIFRQSNRRWLVETHRVMEMVKYTLLQKPTVSNWPTVPRQLKIVLAVSFVILISWIIVFETSKSRRIAKLYNIQASLADTFDLEMKYMNKRPTFSEDEWLSVKDLDGHVYSAYLDVRPEVIDKYSHAHDEIPWAVVRIIAILPMNVDEKRIDCIYKHGNGRERYIYKRRRVTSLKPIEENWGLNYSAFFAICDVVVPENFNHEFKYKENQLPESVAIALYNTEAVESEEHTQFVNVRYPIMGLSMIYGPTDKFMAVCVPVLHHEFNRPLDLIEFVEYHQLLGATHFTFYNSSITPAVDRVLRYYAEREIATVLTWKLPPNYIFEKTLRYEGLFAGLNDCLYRNAFYKNYEYIATIGIDEFIVPRMHNNFSDMMEYLDPPMVAGSINRHASFLFRNVFFYTMYQDDHTNKEPSESIVRHVPVIAKTLRLKEPQQPGYRSRYVVRGRDAIELGNYHIWELRQETSIFSKQFDEVAVEPEVALSHHYSPCEAEETGCYLKNIMIDKTAHRFTKKLGIQVAATCNKIFGDAGCPVVKKEPLA